jgi:predicted acetyltransferase/RimJ/RimL family protein N-acetyltransferase
MKIHFEKATSAHLDTIFSWLLQPHIIECWDNTQAHKDDIVNFTQGRKTPSPYADGKYVYFLAFLEREPFAMLMAIQETHKNDIGQEKLNRLSKTGNTYGLDYMIGNPKFFGEGYGARTLSDFIDYFRHSVDPKADTFLIDPASDNPKAKHVYMKAGFNHVCDFMMEGNVSGAGQLHHLLIRKFDPKISIVKALQDDCQHIQKLWPFYVYDVGRECKNINDWECPTDPNFVPDDVTSYFKDPERKAYLVKVYDKISGFVLLNKATENSANTWNMGEFFIIAKFQGQAIAHQVAQQIWSMHPGTWEVSVIPNNKRAIKFWEKTISAFTYGAFNQQIKEVAYDEHCPRRIIFEFDTQSSIHKDTVSEFMVL